MRNSPWLIMLLLFLLSTFVPHAKGQFYDAGQDPFSIHWEQIQTENFQVIFPEEYSGQAQYVANLLEYAYKHAGESMEHKPRKVSVIIHNQTVISNGFVSWAPARIELYTQAPADNDTHLWMDRLVVHEFRHIVQIDKLNQGITKILSILFGEAGTGIVLGLHMPLWFMEGDAVVTETAFTHSGRGRLPEFEQGLRAQALNRGIYSFDKAQFGSYKDYVPSYYELGYHMVAAARVEYGKFFWSNAVDHVARKPWIIGSFSRGMKKQSGKGIQKHYKHTFSMLDSVWSEQKSKHQYTITEQISPHNPLYANYNPVFPKNDSVIIALKTGLKEIPQIVKITHGKEKKLFYPGFYFPDAFDFAHNTVVWNEQRPDPRWEHRNWSEIMIYDLVSRKRTRLTWKTRYFSPTLSPDATKVAVTETTDTDKNYLVVINTATGEEISRFQYQNNDFIQHPAWHPEKDLIVITALDKNGKRIDVINPLTQQVQNILPSTHTQISNPAFWKDQIIFSAAWSGIDNIYGVDLETGNVSQLISAPFGAINPLPGRKGEKIYFAGYSDKGYHAFSAHRKNLHALPLDKVKDHSVNFYKTYSEQETGVMGDSSMVQKTYDTKRYSRLAHLFHLHSWIPASLDVDAQEVNPGVSLLFQNKLSTSFANVGYLWDVNEQTGKVSASYSYHGLYPLINLNASTGQRRYYYTDNGEEKNFLYGERNFDLTFSLPLQFRKNAFFLGLRPTIGMGYLQINANRNTPERFSIDNQNFSFQDNEIYQQEYGVWAYYQMRTVKRDIYPRWGQILDIRYRHTPFFEEGNSSVAAIRNILYIPGIFPHHGIRLSASWQERLSNPYTFGNVISYPRGFYNLNHQSFSSYTADYAFPVLYPDLSIKYLIYLMRIRANLFADYAEGKHFPEEQNQTTLSESYFSYGIGIRGDMHLFRILPLITLGVQISFTDDKRTDFQLLAGFSIN
ncbi:MAG: TolB family protein [Bacteroidales bacterium]